MKPILFNTEMVRVILDSRKTVTRRVVKAPYYIDDEEAARVSGLAIHRGTNMTDGMPYPDRPYSPGDILYVRETWARIDGDYVFKADDEVPEGWHLTAWHPSIHMPRKAARIFLRVTDVRVERLQNITEEQAKKEGCSPGCVEIIVGPCGVEDYPGEWSAVEQFRDVWNSTIKPTDRARYGWDASPWVWVIEFERCERPRNE